MVTLLNNVTIQSIETVRLLHDIFRVGLVGGAVFSMKGGVGRHSEMLEKHSNN